MYENEMAQLRDVIERAAGEDAKHRLRTIAKTFEKYAKEAGIEATPDQNAEDESTRARLRDAAHIVRGCAYETLIEKIKYWTLNLVSEINKSVEVATNEDAKTRLRSTAREVEEYALRLNEYAHGVILERIEYWALNPEAGKKANERATKWCADNYGGTWNIGLTPPSGWMWTLAMDGELILTPHDLSPPVIARVDVSDYCAGHPHTYAARRWCSYNYRRQWHTDLTPPEGWVWGWIEGALVLRCYDPIPPTVTRGNTNVRK